MVIHDFDGKGMDALEPKWKGGQASEDGPGHA